MLFVTTSVMAQQTSTSSPSDASALEQKIRDLEDRIIALEGQVRTLKAQAVPAAPAGATETATAAAPAESVAPAPVSLGGAGGSAAKALNPDISMIGDFIGVAGGNSISPSPSFQMHESEIGMQAIIDPYARGDFFLSFGESGVDHVLPWVDRPLVTQNLVGGEDGIDDAGVSIERIIPFPKGIFLSATGQVFRGDSGEGNELVFQSHSKSDVSTVAHLRGYKDLNESTNLDLGLSYARGHNELGSDFITSLYGIDATLRWKPLRRAIYHSFVARSEFIWSQRQQNPFEQRAFGMYASGEYQFKRRWFLGGRYDWSDRAREANLTDKGGSVILTYWPSEFSQIRGQYRFTDYAGDHKTNELLMQVLFSLGAHGAHPF